MFEHICIADAMLLVGPRVRQAEWPVKSKAVTAVANPVGCDGPHL